MRGLNEATGRIAAWREALAGPRGQAALSADELDELEDHLLTVMEQLTEDGACTDEESAFREAVRRLGDGETIRTEYTRAKNPMNLPTKLIGTVATLGVIVFIAAQGGPLDVFLDPGSILFVLGVTLGGLWSCFGPRRLLAAISCSLGEGVEDDAQNRRLNLAVFQRGYQLAWASGGLGAIVGVILMLSNLDGSIGPGAALSLLSLLYGGILAEVVFRNLRQWLLNREPGAPSLRAAP